MHAVCGNTHKCVHDSTWFVFTIQWYHYQRKKLLYDESWIIDFDKIEREVGYRGEFQDRTAIYQSHECHYVM